VLFRSTITTPRLIIEEGVIFNGSCRIAATTVVENGRPAPANGQKVVPEQQARLALAQGQRR
jgi:cytoskeletal protein CcmA (bactofilin family)